MTPQGSPREDTAMENEKPDARIQTVCLLIVAAVAIGVAMFYLRPVLIPLVLAVFFTYCLSPIIDFQEKRLKFPPLLASISTALLGCVLLFLLWTLISASVSQIRMNADVYHQQLRQLADDALEDLPLERFGVERDQVSASLFRIPRSNAQAMVSGTVGAIMAVLSNGLLVVIFMIFMLIGKASAHVDPEGLLGQVQSRIQRYIVTKVLVSGMTGILVGVTLSILGVQFAFVFGVLAFMLNFIPNIGSFIATVLPLPVVLLSPDLGPIAKILAIAIPGAIQFAIGNLIEPKIMGDWLDLHPITILCALVYFGMIWGIVGMLLAAPITAVVKIFLQRGSITQPIANVMAGRLGGQPA
jgi:AI-2 transport protein TqsA